MTARSSGELWQALPDSLEVDADSSGGPWTDLKPAKQNRQRHAQQAVGLRQGSQDGAAATSAQMVSRQPPGRLYSDRPSGQTASAASSAATSPR